MSKLLRIFLAFLLCLGFAAGCIFLYFRRDRTTTNMQDRKVFVLRQENRFTLYRNGQPFFIKGAAGNSNIRQLQMSGGNTIRTWDTVNLRNILDEAALHGVAVIAGLGLPVSGELDFYNDNIQVSKQLEAYRKVVNNFKSHPALLLWCLGNEVDFPYKPRYRNFYSAYNDLLEMIHEEDPDHPVTTALINLEARCIYNIRIKVPDLDLIAINTFGSVTALSADLQKLAFFWDGPFIISEWGINGPWESEATAWGAPIENTSVKKAQQYRERWLFVPHDNPRFLGACCFYWGQKQEGTHTWYSFFSPEGEASEVVNAMQEIWTGKPAAHKSPDVRYMLVEGKGARDNILLKPGKEYSAEVLMNDTTTIDSLTFKWELLAEDWYLKNRQEANLKKPVAFDTLITTQPLRSVKFRTPKAEGSYRIFVNVYDRKGYFSTANTPFYVVDK